MAPTPSIGCPGQELPLKEGKPSFLSYPLAVNAHRDLPWTVEFGRKLIIRSDQCKVVVKMPGEIGKSEERN